MSFYNAFSPYHFSNFYQPFYCFIPVFPCDSSFYFSNFHAARFFPQQPFYVEGSGFSAPPEAINACLSGDLAGTSAFSSSSFLPTQNNRSRTGLSREEEGGSKGSTNLTPGENTYSQSSKYTNFPHKDKKTEDKDFSFRSRNRGSASLEIQQDQKAFVQNKNNTNISQKPRTAKLVNRGLGVVRSEKS